MKMIAKKTAAPLLCGLAVLVLLKTALFVAYVPSSSMEPTIKKGSMILGSRIVGKLRRGDVIVFRRSGGYVVKRIAYVPGDVIDAPTGGETLAVDHVASNQTVASIVPDGCYYVLGDNNTVSLDSRYWDNPFVERSQVIARVFVGQQNWSLTDGG